MNQNERRTAALRADRSVIERAAARLRSDAIRSGYAGLQHQHVAFGLALVLDELARHLADLDRAVRWQAVQSCRLLRVNNSTPRRSVAPAAGDRVSRETSRLLRHLGEASAPDGQRRHDPRLTEEEPYDGRHDQQHDQIEQAEPALAATCHDPSPSWSRSDRDRPTVGSRPDREMTTAWRVTSP